MKQHMLKVFKLTDSQKADETPVYVMKDGKLFRTAFHPDGWSDLPDYNLGNDGRVYRTENHPDGSHDLPDYEFRHDMKLYRTSSHPGGKLKTPEFKIND